MKSLKKIELSDREELRVEIRQLKGRAFADVRVHARSRTQEAHWPTGKGFLVPVSRLTELCQAVAELETEARGGPR